MEEEEDDDGFQDMVFKTWDLNFGAWEILRYGFQDMVFRTWDLNFGAWEILSYILKLKWCMSVYPSVCPSRC